MSMTVFIGQRFLLSNSLKRDEEYYFYGANPVTENVWQVNFMHGHSNISTCHSTLFCLNLEVGNSLRFANSTAFMQEDGSIGLRNDYYESSKRSCKIKSIKIVDIGQDFLTVEYEQDK